MIDKMALDLGVSQFVDEPALQFRCRVVYSAMSCWIKAITLDKPIGSQEKEYSGVSRRHLFDRSHSVLSTMINMFPEIREWFDTSSTDDYPENLIRSRLINHGDLLNAGFTTNLALSAVHSNQITSQTEVVYGKTIDKSLHYSGVSSIRHKEADSFKINLENVEKWLFSFLREANWTHDLPDYSQLQFFNPCCLTKTNYAAWQDSINGITDRVILARATVNRNSYSYYLLKPSENLTHRIDPFLQNQGYHIRIMCALRSRSNNRSEAIITKYIDHIKIRFYAFLPLQESVLLESYAWPVQHISDKLEWIMGYDLWDYIMPHIEALNINITEESHGQIRC